MHPTFLPWRAWPSGKKAFDFVSINSRWIGLKLGIGHICCIDIII